MLAAGVLVSGRSSPAEELFGARRRRSRLVVARGPVWCSSPLAYRWVRAGGGSGGRKSAGGGGAGRLLRGRGVCWSGAEDARGCSPADGDRPSSYPARRSW